MKDGWIKAAAATPPIRVADCLYNASQALLLLQRAAREGVGLLVLPELCLTGYTCGDLFLQRTLLEGAQDGLRQLLEGSRGLPVLCAVGLPVRWQGKLYNCAAVFCNGELLGVVPKQHLPNYSEFYERRHFSPAPAENGMVELCGYQVPFGTRLLFCCREQPLLQVAVEICEDLWVPVPPSAGHAAAGATVILNPSASDEAIGKAAYRRELLSSHSARLLCGYLYADAGTGESTSDLVFSGHNLVAENGAILAESQPFGAGWACSEIDLQRLEYDRLRLTTYPQQDAGGYQRRSFSLPVRPVSLSRAVTGTPFVPEEEETRQSRAEQILQMQSHGLKKRMEHTRAKTAVVGISGGLDSCLALLVMARAADLLGRPRSDLLAVTMPGFGTTARTRGNAERLCEALGVTLRTIPIGPAVRQHFADIGHDETIQDITYENAQARERTQILMDVANQTGGLVIGTGDLSELALGWATYNGDHMSMYGVNASIPKTLIRHIVRHEALQADGLLRQVLMDILDTPVSPELLPARQDGRIAQQTEEIVGPYELHDFFLYYLLRWGFAPGKICRLACHAFAGRYDRATVLHWQIIFYRRFFAQQFKRSCLPDGPKVGSVTLSPRGDWRMPSDASAALWLQELKQMEEEA